MTAPTPTAPTPTAATPEELARTADLRASLDRAYAIASPTGAANHLAAWANNHGKALLDLIEAQRAEIERLRVMADEPTTKRVWDGIQAMAGLFADPDHMPTVLEFKAAFDAAFVMDGKPYDVERIKEEWQADYAAMEARATTAEAALAASLERVRVMREALETALIAADEVSHAKGRSASVRGASDQKRRNMEEWVLRTTVALENAPMFARAALQPQEATDGPGQAQLHLRA